VENTGLYQPSLAASRSYSFTASYDEIGNMVRQVREIHNPKQSVVTRDWVYQYNGSRPHAPSAVGDRRFE
jgi:hypothetical protein